MGASWLAVAMLLAPSSGWKPAEAPAPTVWALAGARSWRSCQSAQRQARLARKGASGRGKFERIWRSRAKHCPGAPEVLVIAAEETILEATPVGWMPESDPTLDATIARHAEAARSARVLLDRAIAQAHARGERPPIEAHYFRAYTALMLGQPEAVAGDLADAARLGDAASWRLDRISALAALMQGDLEVALQRANLARLDAPHDGGERQMSRYVWALVLDRAGASAAAREQLRRLRDAPEHAITRRAVESLLPPHERMFLRALEHGAHDERTNATRLWKLYLGREEPTAANRRLAERHLNE